MDVAASEFYNDKDKTYDLNFKEEVGSLYTIISELPYLDNVVKETLRLIPPVHSSIRVAVQDDVVPTSSPMKFTKPDGTVVEEMRSVRVPKGSFVHVPIEAFNLDREVWGSDAWTFKCVPNHVPVI